MSSLIFWDDDGLPPLFFELNCPKCRQWLPFPNKRPEPLENGKFPKVACRKCGPVSPRHIAIEDLGR